MTTIQYLNNNINVPDSWGDIKLRDYENFYNEKASSFRERVDLVSKICNIDPSVVLKWPAEIFSIIIDKIYFIFEPHDVKPSPFIQIENVTYTIQLEEKLTLGEYIDADQAQKEGTNVLSNILAIVCRPEGEEYNSDRNEMRANMFGSLSMVEVQPLLAFFLLCKNALERRIKDYTNLQQVIKSLPQNIKLLRSLGGGTKLSTIWRIIKYGFIVRLLNFRLQRLSQMYNTTGIKVLRKKHSVS